MNKRAFVPSPQQADYFGWVESGRGSAIVKARAGTGKTTTIVKSWSLIPETGRWGKPTSVQAFAFNKTIADEMKGRLAEMIAEGDRAYAGFRVGTFHSVGFYALCKRLGVRANDVTTDDKKLRKTFENVIAPGAATASRTAETILEQYGDFVPKLVSFAKGQGIGAIAPDVEDAWYGLIAHHDLYLDDEDATEAEAIALARALLARSCLDAEDGYIDYDDMLYLPLKWRCRLWQNDWVFVDEAQDTNPVRRAIAKLALRPGGRLVAVGDDRQAIYGFTGASHDALDLIRSEFNAIELPLTVSYRCPKAVAALAQEIVPDFEAHADAPDGSVEWRDSLDKALADLGATDAILCRNTAPLVSAAYAIIARGIGCRVLGREIGAGLVALVKKMKAKNVDVLEERLGEYRRREVAKHTAAGEETKAEAVNDRVECLTVVIANLPENDRKVSTVIRRLEELFSDDVRGVLTLSTVHKAKGKEWPTVAILAPELMPSKWARQEWQAQQEQNLIYVAHTRAQERLLFVPRVTKRARPAPDATTTDAETAPADVGDRFSYADGDLSVEGSAS